MRGTLLVFILCGVFYTYFEHLQFTYLLLSYLLTYLLTYLKYLTGPSSGRAVAQLVEALCHKTEGPGFDVRIQ